MHTISNVAYFAIGMKNDDAYKSAVVHTNLKSDSAMSYL